jgi:hypothetical protein
MSPASHLAQLLVAFQRIHATYLHDGNTRIRMLPQ